MNSSLLIACSTCANNFKHAETNAAGWAIAAMLVVIVPIMFGVMWCMISIARREKAGLSDEYLDDYCPPTKLGGNNFEQTTT